MKTYKAYCFDLDGTVYRGAEPIPEAVETIHTLQSRGIEPYYITNNASVDAESVQEKLATFGIEAPTSHIMTSAVAAAQYCAVHYADRSFFLYGEPRLTGAFEREGLHIVSAERANAVVIGLNRASTYDSLSELMNVVRNGALFISTNGDRIIPKADGFGLGNGSFVEMIRYATGVDPINIGKPEPVMLELIQAAGSFEKEEMLMVGDNYDTDIQAGIRFGIDTAHVAHGVTSTEEVLQKDEQPTYCVHHLVELLDS
ncbi:HAD-IIA family hydrolase [Planococcaceae bacterium Storch 2/2-2]|nr:HAD-IIA family hydrolase [Planococcaceae bacterium Storch 2/2-2]